MCIRDRWTGFALGIFRLVAEFMNNEGTITVAANSLLGRYLDINFLHFALFLFILCAIILVVVSRLTEPQPVASLELVTFQKNRTVTDDTRPKDMMITIGLLICVAILWLLFSPIGIG